MRAIQITLLICSVLLLWTTQATAQATLKVRANCPGATIWVDGAEYGKAPLTMELSGGFHTVAVKLKGAVIYQRKVKLTSGEETIIKANMGCKKSTGVTYAIGKEMGLDQPLEPLWDTSGSDNGGSIGKTWSAPSQKYKKAKPVRVIAGPASKTCKMKLLKKTMKQRRIALRTCYTKLLPKFPKLGGDITVRMSINFTGRVIKYNLLSETVKNQYLINCITKQFKSVRFKPHTPTCESTWTLRFTPPK